MSSSFPHTLLEGAAKFAKIFIAKKKISVAKYKTVCYDKGTICDLY